MTVRIESLRPSDSGLVFSLVEPNRNRSSSRPEPRQRRVRIGKYGQGNLKDFVPKYFLRFISVTDEASDAPLIADALQENANRHTSTSGHDIRCQFGETSKHTFSDLDRGCAEFKT